MLGLYISSSPPLSSFTVDACFYPSAVLEYLLSLHTLLFTAPCLPPLVDLFEIPFLICTFFLSFTDDHLLETTPEVQI